MDANQLWTTMQPFLTRECGRHYPIWFVPLRVHDLRDGVLHLNAPTAFHAQWMRTHFSSVTTEAAQAIIPGLQVQYVYKVLSLRG
jgi:chromosomal replication initiation ATPase DnaA